MKKQLSLLLLFLLSLSLYPQGEADKWYIPSLTALDFSSGAPVALNDNIGILMWEGATSIADAAGNLLFYSDGNRKIYTKNHTVMAGATDMLVNVSMTQGSIFLPKPGSTTIYSFLHLNKSGQHISLYYSEIDVTQGAGLGDVTAIKNVPLAASFEITSEKMAATKHCNGVDYWILVHDATGNAYKAYLLTNAGINPTPVVSNTGTNFGNKAGSSPDALGQMKISPNGTKVSTVFGKQDIIELSDFDKSTGIVSNTITLGKTGTTLPYGTEFSSDNTKVYASGGGASGSLKQWDLCAGSNAAIIASETALSLSTANGLGLQLAPDNKIYLRISGSVTQAVINNPNNAGVTCNFSNMGPTLTPSSGTGAGFTFPNFASNFFYDPVLYTLTPNQTDASNCQDNGSASVTVDEAVCSAALYTYTWSTGFVDGPTNNLTSTISNLAPGNYKVVVSSSDACYVYEDSLSFVISDLTATIPPVTQAITICAGENFTLPDGEVVSATGIYKDTIPAANGCDSVITTNLTVSGILATTLNPVICAGGNHTLPDGAVVNVTATYITTIVASSGCDSTITTNLTVKPLNTFIQTPSICAGQSFTLPDGSVETTAGIYTHTLIGVDGCDSIVTTNLSIIAPVTSTLDPNICPGQSYTMPDGSTESISGTYNYTLVASSGCDSNVTINLTVGAPINTILSPSICAGETYTMPDGSIENSNGTYNFTLTALGGCDSIVTVNLTVLNALTTTLNPSICNGQSYTLPDGSIVNSSGTYTTTLTASASCDSIVTTNLTVGGFLGSTINPGICSGQNYTLPDGTVVNTGGTYTTTINASNGCDSIITTNLTVNTLLTSTQTPQICTGQNFIMPDGSMETNAGIYTHTLTASSGCDSIVTTTLTVITPVNSAQNPIMCEGQSFTLPDGSIETNTGTYVHTLIASTGCDSIVTTNLTVNQNLVSTQNPIICAGESFTLPDGSVEAISGTYLHTITASTGCDSVVTTNLTVKAGLTGKQTINICEGGGFTLPDKTVVNTTGSYTSVLLAADGCDSIVTTDLIVNPVTTTTINPSICSGEKYTLPNGNKVSTAGTYKNLITSTAGCDSMVIVNLSVGEVTTAIHPNVCEGDAYTLSNGNAIGETGTYADTLVAAGGCDSIVTIHLTVNPNPTISLGDDVTIELGQSTSLTSNGTDGTHKWSPGETLDCVTCSTALATPLETTTYTLTVTDGNGCVASKSITVEVLNDISKNNNALYIPNAFTPNEDNTNPTFRPIGDLITENKYLFTIYDRWGQPIFLSQNPLEGWDGSFEGEIVPLDVYAWTLEFNDPQGKSHKLSGKVTVLE